VRGCTTGGALVFLDGAQSAPHIPIDIQALGCDFFALSGHKMAGPMGVGALWARRELLDAMPPYQLGGHMAKSVELLSAEYASGANKFEAGSPNIAGPVAWLAAIEFLRQFGLDKIRAHYQMLVQHTLERLTSLHRLSLFGSTAASERVGIFSFEVEGLDPVTLARGLDRRGIAIRAGDLAAAPLHRSRGRKALARVSLYLYNEPAEIDRLAEELERLGA
jgi:cysteine desulfurase/selenocysteine lyase